jgi:hypothetical protein
VEGYYAEDDSLTEYFQRMRALQEVERLARSRVEHLEEFQRLFEVTSAPLFGEPTSLGKLLPVGKDSLSKALEATFPAWTIENLTHTAYAQASKSDDFSLVGLAALAREPLVITALRETAVLYAGAFAGAVSEPVINVYKWAVDPLLEQRATRFVSLFNAMFNEELPLPGPDNAERYWNAAAAAHVYGRCVRLGYDDSVDPTRHYHWAIIDRPDGLGVRDFWSTDLWTTARFQEALFNTARLPF